MNYIQFNYDTSFIEVLKRIVHKSDLANYLLRNKFEPSHIVDDYADYISMEKDGEYVSYLPHDRVETAIKEGESPWTSKRRSATRCGRLVSRLFKNIPNKETENFSNLIKWQLSLKKTKLEIVSSTDILKYYTSRSYADIVGTLGASCMKYDECQRFFGIYVDNPNVKLLILKSGEGQLLGRALLWHGENFQIMDRIYTCYEYDVTHFTTWAKDNGYVYKWKQCWNNTLFFNDDGKQVKMELEIQLKNWHYDRYPYLDTFKWFNVKTGKIYNRKPENTDGNVTTMSNGSGYWTDYNTLKLDEINEIYWNRDEVKFVNYVGKNTHHSECEYSEINNQYILRKDAIFDDILQDSIFGKEFNHLNNHDLINQRKAKYANHGKDDVSKKKMMEKAISSASSRLFGVPPINWGNVTVSGINNVAVGRTTFTVNAETGEFRIEEPTPEPRPDEPGREEPTPNRSRRSARLSALRAQQNLRSMMDGNENNADITMPTYEEGVGENYDWVAFDEVDEHSDIDESENSEVSDPNQPSVEAPPLHIRGHWSIPPDTPINMIEPDDQRTSSRPYGDTN